MADKLANIPPKNMQAYQHSDQSLTSDQVAEPLLPTSSLHFQDRTAYVRLPKSLQRVLLLQRQQTVGNQAVQRSLIVQRKPEHEAALAAIQGHAMFNLLPLLANLSPDVRTDEEAGTLVGGPRLVTAMRTVQAKGQPWIAFASTHNSELSALPIDQIADIMRFLGASPEARYFKADLFNGDFDGAVDPNDGITIFLRVKIVLKETARLGMIDPGSPNWEEKRKEVFAQFKTDFKQVVEQTWSNKGTIKPVRPIGSVQMLNTKIVVSVVESGEHTVFTLDSDGTESSHVEKGAHKGELHASDNQEYTKIKQVADPTGRFPEQAVTKQSASAHEVGHALGLSHVHEIPTNKKSDDVYGKTVEERESVMGAGNQLKVIRRLGKVTHDDFQPFERVAERWGKEFLPGALEKYNKWSAG